MIGDIYRNMYTSSLKAVDGIMEKAPGKDVIISILKYFHSMSQISWNAKILDVGSGTGSLLNRISVEVCRSWELHGVDSSIEAIILGKKRYPDLYLWLENADNMHFRNSFFEVVISYGSCEHFKDVQNCLIEVQRLLKSGGLFFMMIPTLGIQRTDREDEGWYEEFRLQELDLPIQLQWNLRRETWESYFLEAGLTLYPCSTSSEFGALKPGNFYFGYKARNRDVCPSS